MKMPESMSFDGIDGSKDRTDFFLAALNSRDGYLPLGEMRRHLWMEGSVWTRRAAIRPLSVTGDPRSDEQGSLTRRPAGLHHE